MTDSRERFEQWYTVNTFDYARSPIGSRECAISWKAWQAAERETAKRCHEIVRSFPATREGMLVVIQEEFPGAWE
jgi:hypothetical protein